MHGAQWLIVGSLSCCHTVPYQKGKMDRNKVKLACVQKCVHFLWWEGKKGMALMPLLFLSLQCVISDMQ